MIEICLLCTAGAGLKSDRCESCADFSAFQRGEYSMSALEGLSARGKLAFVLSELAALRQKDELV